MTDLRTAAQQAMEALEGSIALTMAKIDRRHEAITALREALAQTGEIDRLVAFARAIEAALLAKLAAAEMPRPDRNAWPNGFHDLYTEAQLKEYGAACAAKQLSAEPLGYIRMLNGAPTPDDDNMIWAPTKEYCCTYGDEEWVPTYTRSTK